MADKRSRYISLAETAANDCNPFLMEIYLGLVETHKSHIDEKTIEEIRRIRDTGYINGIDKYLESAESCARQGAEYYFYVIFASDWAKICGVDISDRLRTILEVTEQEKQKSNEIKLEQRIQLN